MSTISSSKLISVAQEIVAETNKITLSYFRNAPSMEIKEDDSPVTVADTLAEQATRDILAREFPDHSILGEEFGSGDLTNSDVWVVDPIDGTQSFITGYPAFGFLLAYLKDGKSELSVVSMSSLNEQFVGLSNGQATLNGAAIRTSTKTDLNDTFVYINEGQKLLANEYDVLTRALSMGQTQRFSYDCYPHALVAAGQVDVVIDYDLKPFDYLPLTGLIEAAGGVMSDWKGQPLNFESDGRVISAANAELHQQALQHLGLSQ